MWKKLGFLAELIKELVYDDPEEGKFTSPKFNTRKLATLLLILALGSGLSFMTRRSIDLASEVIELKEEIKKLKEPPVKAEASKPEQPAAVQPTPPPSKTLPDDHAGNKTP